MIGTEIIVAVLALLGTMIGSLAGIRASNRLVEHRLKVLEAKVDKHNQVVERLLLVEVKVEANQDRLEELVGAEKRRAAIRVVGALGKNGRTDAKKTVPPLF